MTLTQWSCRSLAVLGAILSGYWLPNAPELELVQLVVVGLVGGVLMRSWWALIALPAGYIVGLTASLAPGPWSGGAWLGYGYIVVIRVLILLGPTVCGTMLGRAIIARHLHKE